MKFRLGLFALAMPRAASTSAIRASGGGGRALQDPFGMPCNVGDAVACGSGCECDGTANVAPANEGGDCYSPKEGYGGCCVCMSEGGSAPGDPESNARELVEMGGDYCTYSFDYGCYTGGKPACCLNNETECPDEQPSCDVSKPQGKEDILDTVGMGNPSSIKCAEMGFTELTLKDPDGGEYSICIFGDGKACDTWSFFRGECGETNPDFETFCANSGGAIDSLSDGDASSREYRSCLEADGSDCTENDYYMGKCAVADALADAASEATNATATGMPLLGSSYCTFSPNKDCYVSGWPACCQNKTACPEERPGCEINVTTTEAADTAPADTAPADTAPPDDGSASSDASVESASSDGVIVRPLFYAAVSCVLALIS